MKILITGGHSELVYDMSLIFGHKLGHQVVIAGGVDTMKRPDPGFPILHAGGGIHSEMDRYRTEFGGDVRTLLSGRTNVPPIIEFISDDAKSVLKRVGDEFDLIYCFLPELAVLYAEYGRVVYHLIGGEGAEYLSVLYHLIKRGSHVVSYSESHGEPLRSLWNRIRVIHFYKDPNEWQPSRERRADKAIVVYVANDLANRANACHLRWFLKTRPENRWVLAGHRNNRFGDAAQCFSYDAYKELLSSARAFFNLGTEPAPYTLAVIEAAMSGLPILTPNYRHGPGRPRYQVPMLFGEGCVVLPDSMLASRCILFSYLMRKWTCIEIGDAARANAIKHFGDSVLEAWSSFLDEVV